MTKVEPIIPKLCNSWSVPLYPGKYELFSENQKDTPLFGENFPTSPTSGKAKLQLRSENVNYDSP